MKAYQELDIDGLCTLGTVVIDYRGYRITAQSIIPGTSLSYYIAAHYYTHVHLFINKLF